MASPHASRAPPPPPPLSLPALSAGQRRASTARRRGEKIAVHRRTLILYLSSIQIWLSIYLLQEAFSEKKKREEEEEEENA
ncbi:hypothetical protein XA68_10291 [Ophiocordyceps unilateralis]|uniref:Uncharacterized protein n=1 Tax=Ophiocordyceps unilateralis TaxID=268505 RepID=A0A2A9PIW8_OPHUN|nr:hypothetical protein XA68_10291 [Ophiocordyceps unilateralis]